MSQRYAFVTHNIHSMSFDYNHLDFTRPAEKIKAINVNPIPGFIFDGMKKYEQSARGNR
jgi:hypothetical protein